MKKDESRIYKLWKLLKADQKELTEGAVYSLHKC